MKTAICYLSCHHGNTRKVVEAMAQAGDADLIDVRTRQAVRLEEYDCIGFASGIYGFEMHKSVAAFARQYLPAGKPVFFVYTYGGAKGNGAKALAQIAEKKAARCWASSAARATTPSDPSSWWAASPKAAPTSGTWKRRRRSFWDFRQNKER